MEASTSAASTGSSTTSPQGSNQTSTSSSGTPSSSLQGQASQASSVNPNAQNAQTKAPAASTNPNPNAQTQAQAPQGPRKLGETDLDALVTIKIDGQEQDLSLREVIKLQQLERVSKQKMNDAQRKMQDAERFMRDADLEQIAKMRGIDLDSIAEERLAKKYELMQMSPEQRELMELRQWREGQAKAESSSRQELIDQIKGLGIEQLPQGLDQAPREQVKQFLEFAQARAQEAQTTMQKEFVDAHKAAGLPKDKYTFGRMAALIEASIRQVQAGMRDAPLQAGEAANIVKQDFTNHLRETLGTMDAKAIYEVFGKEVIQKIRDHDIGLVSQKTQSPMKGPANQAASDQPKKYLNQLEWRKAMGMD